MCDTTDKTIDVDSSTVKEARESLQVHVSEFINGSFREGLKEEAIVVWTLETLPSRNHRLRGKEYG